MSVRQFESDPDAAQRVITLEAEFAAAHGGDGGIVELGIAARGGDLRIGSLARTRRNPETDHGTALDTLAASRIRIELLHVHAAEQFGAATTGGRILQQPGQWRAAGA